ncbi:UvrD-helicase domain-containing protein [Lyticum sinuosum]|uniref:DNA 3'-5' helicase n=1 Tax=Lyticum sinuosum TaxID=1332059 RepID=A0AAE4VLS7_9RICK|nr:UvrD-helicase domain-containing protein [Lyticum sinuosum]MDZ5760993.1 putative ATP-dependent helicase/nuclease domain protein [Lyticum sinuosum]
MEDNSLRRIAINPKYNVYINASAGSGKTTILIKRIIRLSLITNPQNILCLAYTNSAANEISERLLLITKTWSLMKEEDLVNDLTDLGEEITESLLQKARNLFMIISQSPPKIQTLHSFCLSILQKHNKNIIKLIDGIRSKKLFKELFLIYWQKFFKNKDFIKKNHKNYNINKNDIELLMSNYSEQTIIESIYKMRHYRSDEINEDKNKNFLNIIKNIDKINNCNINTNLDIIKNQILEEILKLKNIFPIFFNKNLKNIDFLLKYNINDLFLLICKLFYTANGVPKIPSNSVFQWRENIIKNDLKQLWNLIQDYTYQFKIKTKHLLEITINKIFNNFISIFHYSKIINQYYEYEDLIKESINLLHSYENRLSILHDLHHKIDHILIDEVQDLSYEQWKLIMLLTDEFHTENNDIDKLQTIFLVGDYKQSIFSFQGANPSSLNFITNYYKQKCKNSQNLWIEIDLVINFRSDITIVNKINEVFPEWNFHQGYSNNTGLFINLPSNEPEYIANMIKNWIFSNKKIGEKDNQFFYQDKKNYINKYDNLDKKLSNDNNTIKYKDIMILVRRNNSYKENLLNALFRLDIPYSGEQNDNNNEKKITLFLKHLISLTRFAVHPDDDLNLFIILKSQFFHIDDKKLMKLYSYLSIEKNISLWKKIELIVNYTDINNNILWLKFLWYKLKKVLFFYKKSKTIAEFYTNCFILFKINFSQNKFFLQEILAKFDDYNINYTNISEIISYNNNIVEEIMYSIFGLKSLDIDNKVRISTIHSAKGLESPIVIVADFFVKYRQHSDICDIVSKDEVDEIQNLKTKNSLYTRNNLYYLIISDEELHPEFMNFKKRKKEEEQRRLFYVAMTRAKNELYFYEGEK